MSLGIVVKGPEGLVLAAESRITLTADMIDGQKVIVNFDNATKLLSFSKPNISVGAVTYGLASLGLRAAHSFIPEFEASLPKERLSIKEFSNELSKFFMDQWKEEKMPDVNDYKGPDMTFVVAGFDEDDIYGRVFLFDIPHKPDPDEKNPDPTGFGITWGGQREFVDRLLQGYDQRLIDFIKSQEEISPELDLLLKQLQMQIPIGAMALQDCVDLAIFFVKTTINAQNLTVGVRGCGGAIDVATITRRKNLQFVQRKSIIGEDKGLRRDEIHV